MNQQIVPEQGFPGVCRSLQMWLSSSIVGEKKNRFFFLTPLKVPIYKTRAGIKRLLDSCLSFPKLCDSYRKRQCNVAERTQDEDKGRGRLEMEEKKTWKGWGERTEGIWPLRHKDKGQKREKQHFKKCLLDGENPLLTDLPLLVFNRNNNLGGQLRSTEV